MKKSKGHIEIDRDLCKECQLCIETCPKRLIDCGKNLNLKGYYPATFQDKEGKCTACALCAIVCPEVAIEVYRA